MRDLCLHAPPAWARTCHDALHHRDEVRRLAEGGRVVIFILQSRQTGCRSQGGSGGWSAIPCWHQTGAGHGWHEGTLAPMYNWSQAGVMWGQAPLWLSYSSRRWDRPWGSMWGSGRDGEDQGDGERRQQSGLPTTPSPCSPVGLPEEAELRAYSSSPSSSAPRRGCLLRLSSSALPR